MTRRRFYAPPIAFAANGSGVLMGADETRHLRDVLRSRSGDEVFVFDGAGREFRCEIETVERDSTQLRVLEEVQPSRPESPVNLTLGVALLKGEKFELVIQKASELGVNRILPLETERADVKLADSHDGFKRVTRWQRIAVEAAKQSGRARVMEMCKPQSFSSALSLIQKELNESALHLMFSER